jgi:hypothetical protein
MLPIFVTEPITWKQIEVPSDIIKYCDMTTLNADREDLRYIDCVWMHMGYYGVPPEIMKEVREEFNPKVKPIFE